MTPLISAVVVAAVAVVALAALTAVGQRRRGGPLALVVLAGLFFPVAWITWYAHDTWQTS